MVDYLLHGWVCCLELSELWPSLLNWWRVAVLFFGECGRKGGGSPSEPSVSLVGSIESFTLEPDLELRARSDIKSVSDTAIQGNDVSWCPSWRVRLLKCWRIH